MKLSGGVTTGDSERAVAHCFTVDVEEWFQVNAFEPRFERRYWGAQESRVEASTEFILQLLSDNEAKGTFFVLGWVAERLPALVRAIAAQGHEIASHGYWHQRIPTISPSEFLDDVRSSKCILEDITGTAVYGYRAPSFSLLNSVSWAAEILVEQGYQYDSSRFPIRRRDYGTGDALMTPHWLDTAVGPLLELPPAIYSALGVRIPVAGGGWLRQLPFKATQHGLRQIMKSGQTGIFYIHPWELDAEQPRVAVPTLTRLRHYRNISHVPSRLSALLGEFRFDTMRSVIDTLSHDGLPRVEFMK